MTSPPSASPAVPLDPPSSSSPVSVPAPSRAAKAYTLKGFVFTLLTLSLNDPDPQALVAQIAAERDAAPDLFEEPLVIDLEPIAASEASVDPAALFALLREQGLVPVGICNASPAQIEAARAAGIPVLPAGAASRRRTKAEPAAARPLPQAVPQATPQPSAALQAAATPAAPKPPTEPPATHVLHQQVRTGQRVFSQGDLTVVAGVNPGAEALAAGSIHVYGPLRGRALAGVKGDASARIFTRCMEAELVSIAGCFRVLDKALPEDVQGKPAQVYLDGERIVIEPL